MASQKGDWVWGETVCYKFRKIKTVRKLHLIKRTKQCSKLNKFQVVPMPNARQPNPWNQTRMQFPTEFWAVQNLTYPREGEIGIWGTDITHIIPWLGKIWRLVPGLTISFDPLFVTKPGMAAVSKSKLVFNARLYFKRWIDDWITQKGRWFILVEMCWGLKVLGGN